MGEAELDTGPSHRYAHVGGGKRIPPLSGRDSSVNVRGVMAHSHSDLVASRSDPPRKATLPALTRNNPQQPHYTAYRIRHTAGIQCCVTPFHAGVPVHEPL